ncbi:CYFA0S01e04126g1_1 [Cyberlindnera fabianii]|uniref:CYFA0S01e04126g1_1 n=1 Tax=Cyberlindnera fabianii TaxID=36022 RepID=A0A061AGQ5_CYBFA|nr:CYFA0S01e04126g1_1 [Cyberlindnera fabianii]
MSFDENVARKKSTRWVKASQANYDGDDWSDDDYYGDEMDENETIPAVPKLPELPDDTIAAQTIVAKEKSDDEFSYGAPTPDLSSTKFADIDIDEKPEGNIESETPIAEATAQVTDDETDEYAQIIQDDADEDDEYIPQTTSRFQAFPSDETEGSSAADQDVSSEVSAPQQHKVPDQPQEVEKQEQPQQDEPYDSNVGTSVFAPFPSDSDQIVPSDEVVGRVTSEPLETQEPVEEEVFDHYSDESTPVPDDIAPATQASHSPIPHDTDSDKDDDYVPRSDGHFHSDFSKTLDRETEDDNVIPGSTYASSIRIDGSDNEKDLAAPYHSDGDDEADHSDDVSVTDMKNLSLRDVSEAASETTATPTIIKTAPSKSDLTIDAPKANSSFTPPLVSPAPYELSDADTLHIQDPESPHDIESTASRTEGGAESTRSEVGNTSRLSTYEGLQEHAYLRDLISTPDPNSSDTDKFAPVPEQGQPDGPDPELGSRKSMEPQRDSQFYHEVNDYFDDYTDESAVNEKGLGLTRTQSSGSLSTGGFSIRSEGYRSSKLSDRTESFTGDRTASFTNRSFSDAQSTQGSTKDAAEKESHLNPAMSINFGQWRPNTESFRDQFISGTGNNNTTAPPLPKIDHYSRNSRGEIIEDNASMAESIAPSHTDFELKKQISISSATSSNNTTQNSTSMLSVLDNEEEQHKRESRDLKDGTSYKTPSETMLPVHIPLDTPSSTDSSKPHGHYFHEHLSTSSHTLVGSKKLPMRKPPSYDIKKIATIDNPQLRIKKYREAREEEANVYTGLEVWIDSALEKVEMVSYKSPVTSHVKQAYAEASQFSRKHTNINMGSFLNKRKVLSETSSSAHSIAKGAKGFFSKGRKMIKSEK